MKRKLWSVWVLISVLCLKTSCTHKETSTSTKIDLDLAKEYLASEIFEELDYVLLDYPDETPIVNAYKMLFTDKHIIVESLENASIFIFDTAGKLENIIRNYGDGPGEFRIFDGLSLVGNDQIRVDVGYLKKSLVFDFKGNLLEETINQNSESVYHGQDFMLQHFPYGELDQQFIFIRSSALDTVGFVPARKGTDQMIPFGYVHTYLQGPTNDIYFREKYTSNVYVFNQNGYLKDSIVFDFGKYQLDWETKVRLGKDTKAQREYFTDNKKVEYVISFFPMPFGYFLSATYDYKKPHWIFLDADKQVKKVIAGITNDIDQMPLRQYSWTYHDDWIIYQMDSRTFFNSYVETFQGQSVDTKNVNLHAFFNQKKEALKEEKIVLVKMRLK
ncbi:6-bladed beta-propeller [Mongoliitalea lutea]|uniref:6-bladed beta-propeller n=1 Tax=Mongoliitalea lutea TaxID=849756 RepID=UPI00167BF8B4|nr:6-bladed beta-propeller [Mongoliitalea lutea]